MAKSVKQLFEELSAIAEEVFKGDNLWLLP